MTVVAVWFEPHDNAVWAVSDTRVTGVEGAITDGAAKILPLTMTCLAPGPTGFFDQLTLSTTFGFAYSGSTLVGVMTYTVANTLIQSLSARPGERPPNLMDVAGLVARVAERYVREVGSDIEAVIFGWCPLERRYRAALIQHDPNAVPRRMTAIEQPLLDNEFCILLGTAKERVRRAIERTYEELNGLALKRAPRLALQRLIEAGDFPEIGGSLQIGMASQLGFQLMSHVAPLVRGQPQAARYFLGINIDDEIGLVGQHFVGMTGTI